MVDGDYPLRRMAFGLLLDLYTVQCEAENTEPDFLHDDFPAFLRAIDQTFPPQKAAGIAHSTEDEYFPLLGYFDIGSPYGDELGWRPLELSFTQSARAYYPIQLWAYLINPFSDHQEEAIAYLEHASAWVDAETILLLSTQAPNPVMNDAIEEEITEQNGQIKKLQDLLAGAQEQYRPGIEAEIDAYKQILEDLQQRKWTLSPQDIERIIRYRPQFVVRGAATFFAAASKEIGPLAQRFSEGSIGADELILTLQNIARMILLESQ